MAKPTTGPIARKLSASLSRVEKAKVVDIGAWNTDDRGLPPGFAAYSSVTNWAMGIVEAFQNIRELCKFYDRIQNAEDEYQPSSPPMSPLSRSYFWHWAIYDLSVGAHRETLGSIWLALGRSLQLDPAFLSLLEKLVDSRLGLFIHEGVHAGAINLRELVTDQTHEAVCASGHDGERGELWLARALPPPGPGMKSVVVTTPYVILEPPFEQWQAFFERTLHKTKITDRTIAYRDLMKNGLAANYWHEYVFEGYMNHRDEVIFLAGLPDVAASRPHSRANSGM